MSKELRVPNVSSDTMDKLDNITSYYQTDRSSFIRMWLRRFIDSFPDDIKNYKEDDDSDTPKATA